ncbi:MAG TPA: HIT family protein [Candidatus Binataceae bacterium]|nr:HIT family protein [Candidatus Binataceae bacterium]
MPPTENTPRPCGICAMIDQIRRGEFPDLVAELPRSWVILGDAQFYRGYCVILAKRHATEPHLMPRGEAHELLDEMMGMGRAISSVLAPLKLNYECLGNQEPHVHWHIFPRYEDDPMRLQPVWLRAENERKVALEESARLKLIDDLRSAMAKVLPAARWPHRN